MNSQKVYSKLELYDWYLGRAKAYRIIMRQVLPALEHAEITCRNAQLCIEMAALAIIATRTTQVPYEANARGLFLHLDWLGLQPPCDVHGAETVQEFTHDTCYPIAYRQPIPPERQREVHRLAESTCNWAATMAVALRDND